MYLQLQWKPLLVITSGLSQFGHCKRLIFLLFHFIFYAEHHLNASSRIIKLNDGGLLSVTSSLSLFRISHLHLDRRPASFHSGDRVTGPAQISERCCCCVFLNLANYELLYSNAADSSFPTWFDSVVVRFLINIKKKS